MVVLLSRQSVWVRRFVVTASSGETWPVASPGQGRFRAATARGYSTGAGEPRGAARHPLLGARTARRSGGVEVILERLGGFPGRLDVGRDGDLLAGSGVALGALWHVARRELAQAGHAHGAAVKQFGVDGFDQGGQRGFGLALVEAGAGGDVVDQFRLVHFLLL